MGYHVDGLKFAGGSFSLFPEDKLRQLLDLAHEHGIYVSTVSSQHPATLYTHTAYHPCPSDTLSTT